MSDMIVTIRVEGVLFEVEKETLLRVKGTYFHGLLSSGAWQPDADGVYCIDRPAMGFGRILEYLRSGNLCVEGLTQLEMECVYSSLDYLLIPYNRQYNTLSLIEGFIAQIVCELSDGRLCGTYGNDIIVWNLDTNIIEMTMMGHTEYIQQVIQLYDGRVCSCSRDRTIKLWNIATGLCDLTLTGHTQGVYSVIQLFDERICSGSWDETIRVWNISTGVCEIIRNIYEGLYCIVQLADSRICCGDDCGTISIYNVLTCKCEISWEAHTYIIHAIVCIDSITICSGSSEGTIKVWNIATGECERTLEGHTDPVYSMVLMRDGRLCSASSDGAIKLWNLDTGECESTLDIVHFCIRVLQLEDGRLLSIHRPNTVVVWS